MKTRAGQIIPKRIIECLTAGKTASFKNITQQMTHEQFLQLPEAGQSVFASKLIHAIRNNKDCFMYADFIVQAAQTTGMFKDVKFGSEVYIPQVIGYNNELS